MQLRRLGRVQRLEWKIDLVKFGENVGVRSRLKSERVSSFMQPFSQVVPPERAQASLTLGEDVDNSHDDSVAGHTGPPSVTH
jgi:hypothetical protein